MDKTTKTMESKITEISKYNNKKLKEFFETENIDKLHNIKLYCDDIYYNTGKSSGLTDEQYDMLKETLLVRDPDYVVPVGSKIRDSENKKELPFWLGSMDKIKSDDSRKFASWVLKNKSDKYILEDKLDGVSCLITIKNKKIKLYTRGDGIFGSDISFLTQYFDTIPKNITEDINVRGELIIQKKIFDKKYTEKYANPRNMVSGLLSGKTIRDGLKDINFIAYEIVGDGHMKKPTDQLKYLKNLGFTTVRNKIISYSELTVDNLIQTLIEFKKTSPYEIDGIIVQSDLPYERNISGNPDYAFAFKMLDTKNIIQAEVIGVDWNVSKWGQLKPRVEIKPVLIGGVTITWATGFNAKYIKDNSIGTGAIIEITRSGDVIPYILRVIKQAPEADLPDNITYNWNETGVDIYTDDFCDEMCIKLIANFFSKLGIKHVAEQNVKKIYESGYNSILKILSASQKDFEKIDGFGTRLAERTYDNIHNGMKNLSLENVLGSSSVFGFGMGRKKMNILFLDFPDILTEYKKMSKKQIIDRVMKIEGFSEKSAIKIAENVKYADQFVNALKKYATFEEKVKLDDSMNKINVVFSGFRNVKLQGEIEARGGNVKTSVSKNTDIVIADDKNSESSKVQKARDLGIPIMDQEEFKNKYNINI